MLTDIFYFSGAGNSLAVAKELAENMPEARVLSISKLMASKNPPESSADRIGFVYPVYCHVLPKQVETFVKLLDFKSSAAAFSIVTHNGEYGTCGQIINRILKKRNRTLIYSNHILMPGISIMADGYTSTEEERQRRISESHKKIRIMASDILNGSSFHYENPDNLLDVLKGQTMFWTLRNILKINRKYHATESCTGCGICRKVCPVNNIQLADSKPVWGNNCEYCLACIHWCPARAVQIDKGTETRIRYHHPDISVKDIAYR